MTKPNETPAALRDDPQRYRVTLFCACNNDYAVGYGPTAESARQTAYGFFRKAHGKRERVQDEILSCVTADGSHYEDVSTVDAARQDAKDAKEKS